MRKLERHQPHLPGRRRACPAGALINEPLLTLMDKVLLPGTRAVVVSGRPGVITAGFAVDFTDTVSSGESPRHTRAHMELRERILGLINAGGAKAESCAEL